MIYMFVNPTNGAIGKQCVIQTWHQIQCAGEAQSSNHWQRPSNDFSTLASTILCEWVLENPQTAVPTFIDLKTDYTAPSNKNVIHSTST